MSTEHVALTAEMVKHTSDVKILLEEKNKLKAQADLLAAAHVLIIKALAMHHRELDDEPGLRASLFEISNKTLESWERFKEEGGR